MTRPDASRRYGVPHRRMRAQLVARYRRGQPCAICTKPMTDPPNMLDLAHGPDGRTWLGLAHRACNRGDAARLANLTRAGKNDPPPRPRTRW